MNHRNGFLERLSKVADDNTYCLLLDKILNYLIVDDWVHQTNSYKIFRELYIKKKKNLNIVLEHKISSSTLTRYIKKYEYIVKCLVKNIVDFKSLRKFL